MRALILAALVLVATGYAADSDASIGAAGSTAAASVGGVRLSAGLGAGSFGLVGAGRVLVVPPATRWRFGVQGTAMTEMKLFVTPNENSGTVHVLAARELVPSGTTSALLFAGVGGGSAERRGHQLPSEGLFGTDYESVHESGPSVLLGVDFGVSFRRKLGISSQVGAELGVSNSVYWVAQLDIGSW